MSPTLLTTSDLVTRHDVMSFARSASMEISPHDEALLPALVNRLPLGTTLYVAHPPKAALSDVIRVASKAQALGFRASPHILARRLASERDLRSALRDLTEADVQQVLLVAGDCERPLGKFTSTLEVLASGALTDMGIASVGVAGHPEGHKAIGPTKLLSALEGKQAFAQHTGTKVHIVTQFGFNPAAVGAWQAHLLKRGVTLPIHVGIAGPTPLPKLIRFAMQCGIGASLGSLVTNMSALGNLVRPTIRPDEMLVGVLRRAASEGFSHIVRPHFFAFGGAIATASWLRAVVDGRFELLESGELAMTG